MQYEKDFVYVDISKQELTSECIEKYLDFRRTLDAKFRDGKCMVVYRGVDKKFLRDRLNNTHEGVGWSETFHRLFIVGEKSKSFLRKMSNNDSFDEFIIPVDDVSDGTFLKLFRCMCELVHSDEYKNVIKFCVSEDFKSFFSNANERQFVSKVKIFNRRIKEIIRDYYLYLLHVAAAKNISKYTLFVSTSLVHNVARNFACPGGDEAEGLIYHYYIPQPYYKYAISPSNIRYHRNVINKADMPNYNPKKIYYKESEVSIKGVLFPHFIVGIEFVETKKFVVNPHILGLNAKQIPSAINNGIYIDQMSFGKDIRKTLYARMTLLDSRGKFHDCTL